MKHATMIKIFALLKLAEALPSANAGACMAPLSKKNCKLKSFLTSFSTFKDLGVWPVKQMQSCLFDQIFEKKRCKQSLDYPVLYK